MSLFSLYSGNIEQLADRIIQLIEDDSLRKKMAETNYRYVREQFDIKKIAFQMEEYLNEVIHECN